jgi:MerR family transcriptional regulator, thiopeptide resistance regulator
MGWTVGELAAVAGVSVRTLHHYDEIGLLRPDGRSGAGYRRYGEAQLDRLQQIRWYRELGFPLEEIATLLDEPGVDAVAHLRRQHQLLTERLARTAAMVAAVEKALEARQMGISLSPRERFEVFGDADPERYAEEAGQRWGETDAYRESQRRAGGYDKARWQEIQAAQADLVARLVAALTGGEPADGPVATALAEEHRAQISRWFYDCSYEMHVGLAEMYVNDPRFTAHYEEQAPGLARYLHDAIVANAS